MVITKARLIYGDAIVVIVLCALYFITAHFTQNVLPMVLVLIVLIARSIFWHVNYYKANGKIY